METEIQGPETSGGVGESPRTDSGQRERPHAMSKTLHREEVSEVQNLTSEAGVGLLRTPSALTQDIEGGWQAGVVPPRTRQIAEPVGATRISNCTGVAPRACPQDTLPTTATSTLSLSAGQTARLSLLE